MTKISLLTLFTFTLIMTLIFIIILNNLHPIFLVIFLISYTLIICFLMSMWRTNYLYSIILFLIIIRGLLIIFLYFSRLISNEQNKIHWRPILLINLIINFIALILLRLNNWPQLTLPHPLNSSPPLINLNSTPPFTNVTKIFLYPNNSITLISIFYLLIALFTIIKICSLKSSSLRKIN